MKWIAKLRSNFSKVQRRYVMREAMFERDAVYNSRDPIRYATVALALKRLNDEGVPGHLAELGVYKGEMSRFIRQCDPRRTFYLFDTFEGFPEADIAREACNDRFDDTSLEVVKKNIGDVTNVVFKKGYFPETAKGLEDLKFAFVMMDVDLYNPTLSGLEYFCPRVSPGGYIMIHDYNSLQPNEDVKKAVSEYRKKQELKIIDVPDVSGSVIIRM